ncbi:MAG: hypothetical protein J6Q67_00230 [Clostridia bacterium]|nr:hypothetical protein [Clostridia bacterium]
MIRKNILKVEAAGLEIRVHIAGRGMRLSPPQVTSTDPALMKGLHSHFTYEIFFVTDGVTKRDVVL